MNGTASLVSISLLILDFSVALLFAPIGVVGNHFGLEMDVRIKEKGNQEMQVAYSTAPRYVGIQSRDAWSKST